MPRCIGESSYISSIAMAVIDLSSGIPQLLLCLVLLPWSLDSIPISKGAREYMRTLKQHNNSFVLCERYGAWITCKRLWVSICIKNLEGQALARVASIAKYLRTVERLPPDIKELTQGSGACSRELHMDQIVSFIDVQGVEAGLFTVSCQRHYSRLRGSDDANTRGNSQRRIVRVKTQMDAVMRLRSYHRFAGQATNHLPASGHSWSEKQSVRALILWRIKNQRRY